MAVRQDVDLNFSVSPRIATVKAPSTTITVQDLYDTLRDRDGFISNLIYPKLCDAAGKDDLGGGVKTAITLTLRNTKLAFEARSGPDTIQCTVTGGNLVATNAAGAPMSPIEPTAYTQVMVAQSVAAAIIEEWSSTEKTQVKNQLANVLGLVQENFFMDQTSFDSQGRMTAARIRIYSTAADVPNGTPVATYQVEASYSAQGIQTYKVTKL